MAEKRVWSAADIWRCAVSAVMDWSIPLIVGAVTGILSGFGVGGGTVLLVYLTAVVGMEQHLAQGINLLYFLPAGLLALPNHWKNGYIEKKALLPCMIAGLICAALAAWGATALDTGILRKCFGGFLILIGARELFSQEEQH